jgi:transposase
MQVPRPDREIWHEPGACRECGADLAGRPVTGVQRRQVFDLPPVKVKVTGHQLIERECGCGQRTRAAAPDGADAPACYGPRIAAIMIYLYLGQFLSRQRTAQALAELSGTPLSPGTVGALTARAAVGAYDAEQEQHVIIAMSNGILREFHTPPGDSQAPPQPLHTDLATIPGIMPIVDASGYQHAIVATANGDIHEVWWTAGHPDLQPRERGHASGTRR